MFGNIFLVFRTIYYNVNIVSQHTLMFCFI